MAQYGAGDRGAAIDTWARGAFGSEYRAALEAALPGATEQAVADSDALFQGEAPAIQQWSFTAVEAQRLRQPVLSVYHRDPRWEGFEATHRQLQAWLPQLESVVLPEPTHLLQIVNPQGAAEALAHFWARHPVTGA
jgi:3-oxoadipate enol-lactonase